MTQPRFGAMAARGRRRNFLTVSSARLQGAALATLLLLGPSAAMAADEAALALGKKVFLETSEPQCGLCHTLADAGTAGEIGPILDDLQPSADRVRTAVVNGIGAMPPYDTLTKEEIEAVALYVSSVTGKRPASQ